MNSMKCEIIHKLLLCTQEAQTPLDATVRIIFWSLKDVHSITYQHSPLHTLLAAIELFFSYVSLSVVLSGS